MSNRVNYLHSHSGLERELKFKKNVVLVDEKYKELFEGEPVCQLFVHNKMNYYKVNILSFFYKGGVFKNLFE